MTTDSRRVRIIKNLTKRRRRSTFPLGVSHRPKDFDEWYDKWFTHREQNHG